jgi:hypothetical protein
MLPMRRGHIVTDNVTTRTVRPRETFLQRWKSARDGPYARRLEGKYYVRKYATFLKGSDRRLLAIGTSAFDHNSVDLHLKTHIQNFETNL